MMSRRDRLELVAPTPLRLMSSALGAATAGLPSLSAHADARAVALLGVLALLATSVVGRPGLATFGCAAAVAAAALACVHGAPTWLPVGVALLLLCYLLVADVATAPGALRGDIVALATSRIRLLVLGALVVLGLAALALADVGGSFWFAIAAIVGAVVAVALARVSSARPR